jgi:predicted dehydrogenase
MKNLKQINIAVTGLGFMGITHLKAYQKIPNARIVAVCDSVRIPENSQLTNIAGNFDLGDSIKLDFSKIKKYRDFNDLIADPEIDLIDLCVPTVQHHTLAVAALNSGKHVVCEKPMARTSKLAWEMVNAAKQNNKLLIPAMCMRFWPEWQWLKSVIDENKFGRVISAHFSRYSEAPSWSREIYLNGTQSGGALLDLHIHDTDFVQFCFGQPKAVFSTGIKGPSGSFDHVFTNYLYSTPIVITAEASWLMPKNQGFNMAFNVILEKAVIDYDFKRPQHKLFVHSAGQSTPVELTNTSDGYQNELQFAINRVAGSEHNTTVSAEDGALAVEICEAEEKSIITETPVQIKQSPSK